MVNTIAQSKIKSTEKIGLTNKIKLLSVSMDKYSILDCSFYAEQKKTTTATLTSHNSISGHYAEHILRTLNRLNFKC